MTPEALEWRKRWRGERMRALWATPEYRERVTKAMRETWARPRLRERLAQARALAHEARRLKIAPENRAYYQKLRRELGVTAARAAMGIEA